MNRKVHAGFASSGWGSSTVRKLAASASSDWNVAELQAFADSLRDQTPPPVAGSDGRTTLAIGLAATRALREGRPVDLEEIE